jgi:hypothetical protein
MSMNVNTTGTVYGSYQNTYKAGTVDKKKETAKTTENDKVKKNVTESIAEKKRHKKCLKICVAQEQIWTLWLQILKMVIMLKIF